MSEQIPRIVLLALGWTVLLEGLTAWLRFGRRLSMRSRARRFGALTAGIRIHHAFPAMLALAAVPVISPSTGVFVHLSAFLFGAILSDLVHHVFVLRWSTGDHEFHLLAEGRSPTDLRAELAAFSASGALAYGLFWGALIEALTVYLRFGLQLQSQRETAFLASFTCGLRVHHGYLGLMMILCSILLSSTASWKSNALAIVGWALLSSDLVHHFVVLQMLTGDPQFHLTY